MTASEEPTTEREGVRKGALSKVSGSIPLLGKSERQRRRRARSVALILVTLLIVLGGIALLIMRKETSRKSEFLAAYQQAVALQAKGQNQQALDVLAQIRGVEGDTELLDQLNDLERRLHLTVRLDRAEGYMEGKDYGSAAAEVDAVLDEDSRNPRALKLRRLIQTVRKATRAAPAETPAAASSSKTAKTRSDKALAEAVRSTLDDEEPKSSGRRRHARPRRSSRPRRKSPPAPTTGTLVVRASRPGLVTVDGASRGRTPLTLTLSPGTHSIVVIAADDGGVKSQQSVTVAAGATAHVDVVFPKTAPPAPAASAAPKATQRRPTNKRPKKTKSDLPPTDNIDPWSR